MRKLLLGLIAATLLGCASTSEQQMRQLVFDARDVGEIGTRFALLENPGFREALQHTADGLIELERLPDPLTVDAFVGILQRLPVNELQSPKAQLALLGGKIVIRRLTGNVELGSFGIRPIVIALREGIEAGLKWSCANLAPH